MKLYFAMSLEKISIYLIILKKFSKKVSFIIGPEGGFSSDEVKMVYNSR